MQSVPLKVRGCKVSVMVIYEKEIIIMVLRNELTELFLIR